MYNIRGAGSERILHSALALKYPSLILLSFAVDAMSFTSPCGFFATCADFRSLVVQRETSNEQE